MNRLVVATCVVLAMSSPVSAGGEDAYLKTAQILYSSAEGQEPELQRASYLQVREILDRIVEDFPSSDIAVRILLKDNLGGIDVTALDAALERTAPQDVAGRAGTPEADQAELQKSENDVPKLDDSSDAPVIALAVPDDAETNAIPDGVDDHYAVPPRPEEEIIADVQAELNRLGCNAGPVDGVTGRKTRAAFRNFINETGSELSEDALATEAAVRELKEKDGKICKVRTMASTPASALAGSWGFRGDCPGFGNRVIRNTGRLSMRYVGNNTLRGTARNKQGNSGPAVIQFQGGRTAATIIRFGVFTLKGNLTRSSRNMTISGTGSRRCKISLWKN
jgi:hypothetical protein